VFAAGSNRFVRPALLFEWLCEWAVYGLKRWAFLELLLLVVQAGTTVAVLGAVLSYRKDREREKEQRHNQAWLLINSAQGRGGDGGRVAALHSLHRDSVLLNGVDVHGADLVELHLPGGNLAYSNLQNTRIYGADFRNASFTAAKLDSAEMYAAQLQAAEFLGSSLNYAVLHGSNLSYAEFVMANMRQAVAKFADLHGASFLGTDLRGADLFEIRNWTQSNMRFANVAEVRNAPDGFIEWALAHGAVNLPDDSAWQQFRRARILELCREDLAVQVATGCTRDTWSK
jgi:uncharacterized protein YjbI with pentapeptide repeats